MNINTIGVMIFWRVILGIGIGGGYPTAAAMTSEVANVRWRGIMTAAAFAASGAGQLGLAIVFFCCIVGFRQPLMDSSCDVQCQVALDKVWRIVIGLGLVPAIVALYIRLIVPETVRFTLDVVGEERAAAADAMRYISGRDIHETPLGFTSPGSETYSARTASLRGFMQYFGSWTNGRVLLGTAGSWFLLDIAFVRMPMPAGLIYI